jgi:hypothetical protein
MPRCRAAAWAEWTCKLRLTGSSFDTRGPGRKPPGPFSLQARLRRAVSIPLDGRKMPAYSRPPTGLLGPEFEDQSKTTLRGMQ